MARIDDIVYSYIHLDRIEALDLKTRQLIEEALRYGFQQGENLGKYKQWARDTQEEMSREVFQETKRQKVVRTYGEYNPVELQNILDEGWTVAMVNHLDGGYGLEYILEKTENLGNSKAVKNPEE